MIICTNCGNHNEDNDEFCGSCGKFLEWVGQKVEDPVKVEVAEPEAEPEDVKVGLIDRVKAAVGIEAAAGGGSGLAEGAPPVEGIVIEEPVDPAVEAERAKAAALADEQERARLEAEAADQAERERKAAEDAERAERERVEAELAAAAALASQQAAEAAAKEAAEQQARREAEAAERERAAAVAREAAAAAERERLEAEAAAMAAAESEAERQRLEEEAKAAAEAAERERVAAEAEAAAAEAARAAEEKARREAEEAAAKARAEEEARKAAEAEETRRKAEEERARREAEARAEAARRAAALLAQPKAAPAPEPAAAPAADAAVAKQGTVAPTAPVAPAPPKRGAPAPPPPASQPAAAAAAEPVRAAMAPSQEPAKPKAPPKPATQVKADEGPKPGDLICDSCGTGNDPSRKFCRRCGNSLAKAEPVKKVPWWKRLFAGGKKKQRGKQGKGKKAITGAKQASFKAEMAMARLRNAVMILAALGLAGGFMVPSVRAAVFNTGRDGINKARDTLFPNFDPIRPVTVTASSEAPDHPAVASADLAINTYWSEGAEGDGVGQVITYTFNEPFELAKILVTPGAIDPNQPDLFLKQPRPKDIHLVFDNGGSADISLKDEVNKAQTFTIKGAKGITKVELSITSVHPGTGGQDTSIAEVEFRKRA